MAHSSGAASGLGREIVLGLLVERPANCYQLDMQLQERFGAFDYAAGTARHAVRGLVRDGLVRTVRAGERGPLVDARGAKLYEATLAGKEHFRWWMRRSISGPPVREELDARIALCQRHDLPRLIEIVREAEALCLNNVQALNHQLRELRQEQEAMEWQQRVELAISGGKHAWWESRIRWLQRLRIYLEHELSDEGDGRSLRMAAGQ